MKFSTGLTFQAIVVLFAATYLPLSDAQKLHRCSSVTDANWLQRFRRFNTTPLEDKRWFDVGATASLSPDHMLSLNQVSAQWSWSPRLVVAMPLFSSQLGRSLRLMSSFWRASPPCRTLQCSEVTLKADLLIFLTGGLSDQATWWSAEVSRSVRQHAPQVHGELKRYAKESYSFQDAVRHLLQVSRHFAHVRSSFDNISVRYIALPDEYLAYLNAPNAVFYKTMHMLEKDPKMYGAVLQIEPDMLPIRRGWLTPFIDEAAMNQCCSKFWQIGSVPRALSSTLNQNAERKDFHLNGNSIYCLRDPAWTEYRSKVQAFFPRDPRKQLNVGGSAVERPSEHGVSQEIGFDHALYRYRMHMSNHEYGVRVASKFVANDYIINAGDDPYDLDDLQWQAPRGQLVHGKWPFMDKADALARESFVRLIHREPSIPEREKTTSVIRDIWSEGKTIMAHDVIDEVCSRYSDESDLFAICDWQTRYPGRFYLWTNDFHAAPIGCQAGLFAEIGVVVHAEIDGFHCEHFGLCRKRLKLPLLGDDRRGFSLDPDPKLVRQQFFDVYKNEPEFQRVDGFICSHPAANCELFVPFQKPIIIYATTRIECGRHDDVIDWRQTWMGNHEKRWMEWGASLKYLAKNPRNIVLTNNYYDAAYVYYFTGVKPRVIPSWCGSHIDPDKKMLGGLREKRPEVLLGPYRDNLDFPAFRKKETWSHPVLRGLTSSCKRRYGSTPESSKWSFTRMRDIYQGAYHYAEVARHPAVLFIPYQMSVMSFFELYRANVPIFAPSHALLCEWHDKYNVTFERIYGHPKRLDTTWELPFDPNSEDPESFAFWSQYADMYRTPYVQLFDSWDHFLDLLEKTDLDKVRREMKRANSVSKQAMTRQWAAVFRRLRAHAPNQNYDQTLQYKDIFEMPEISELLRETEHLLSLQSEKLPVSHETLPMQRRVKSSERLDVDGHGLRPTF